ncbi:MAG: EamA family transporter, partial [Gammaproteobacteria bacterium]
MDRIPPILLALVCVLAWSFIPIVSRIGQADIDGLQFLFWTNFLSTLSVGFVTKNLRIKLAKEFDVIKCSQTMYLGFLGCFLYYLCIYHGYAKGDSVEVLVVQYLWPPMISIFAVFILKER